MLDYYDHDIDATPPTLLYQSFFVSQCLSVSAFTFLVYEYALTFGKEVEYFWKRPTGGGTLLFFLNRYLPILVKIINLSGYLPTTDQSCRTLVIVLYLMVPLQYFSMAGFAAMRTRAISNRNKPLTILAFLLGIATFGFDVSRYHWLVAKAHPQFGCIHGLTISPSLAARLTIAGRSLLIACDSLVLVTTWVCTIKMGILRRPSDSLRSSFWTVMFRDGTVHFCVLLLVNVSHLVLSLHFIYDQYVDPACYSTLVLTQAITSVLISRFLINVRDVNKSIALGMDRSTIPTEHALQLAKALRQLPDDPGVPRADSSHSLEREISSCQHASAAGPRPRNDPETASAVAPATRVPAEPTISPADSSGSV